MDAGNSQEELGVRYGAEENTARSEVFRDIFKHHTRLGLALERVMHAELHRNCIEWSLER